jgi:hypothetical protein
MDELFNLHLANMSPSQRMQYKVCDVCLAFGLTRWRQSFLRWVNWHLSNREMPQISFLEEV